MIPGTATSTDGRPTLLVFTLGPEAEVRRRRLLPAPLRDREAALYGACLEEALAAGRGCGCRLEVSTPGSPERLDRRAALPAGVHHRPQGDGGFGERLAAAFDAPAPAAGRPVVAVGTDTPGLTERHVRRALALLDDGPGTGERVVVGPSPDGGLYLLAAARPLGEVLRQVPWRRRGTLAALRRALAAEGLTVVLLEPLADLDHAADLERWLARRPAGTPVLVRLAAALGRLLAALRLPALAPLAPAPRPAPVPVRSGRAPPRA